MSVTLLSGKAVVASWRQHHVEGIEGVIALHNELLRGFKFCVALHFDAERPCYIRVLVRAEQNATALADEIVAVIQQHLPLELDASQIVETRVVPIICPECGRATHLLACDCQEQKKAYQDSAKFEDRVIAAAAALWQALDYIAEIDSIAGGDARFRLDARQLAKLRLEHASKRGRELLWSWQSPLPPGLLDLAAKDLHHKLHGPAPAFLERIAEAAKTATADKPAFVEVQPEKYDAADCIRVPPKIAKTRAAAAAIVAEVLLSQDEPPPYILGTFERKPIDSVGALMPEGLAGYAPAPTPSDVANALESVDPANPDFTPALDLLADAEFPEGEPDASAD